MFLPALLGWWAAHCWVLRE